MIDWGIIISGVIGIIGGGGLTTLLLHKQTKASAEADAVDKAASAMKQLLLNMEKQQEVSNVQLEQKDTLINQNETLIIQLQDEINKNKREISELTIKVVELTRKVKGHESILSKEIGKKKYAERLICFREDCEMREPVLGTFETPDPITAKIQSERAQKW